MATRFVRFEGGDRLRSGAAGHGDVDGADPSQRSRRLIAKWAPALIKPLVKGITGAESVVFTESAHSAMVEEPERYDAWSSPSWVAWKRQKPSAPGMPSRQSSLTTLPTALDPTALRGAGQPPYRWTDSRELMHAHHSRDDRGRLVRCTRDTATRAQLFLESPRPMWADELVAELLELGCHQSDIGDAFVEANPDWLDDAS